MKKEIKLNCIFFNTQKSSCSIYESGLMVYNILKNSDRINLDYKEISANDNVFLLNYDLYIFNYHQITMGWLDTSSLSNLPGKKITIVLEVLPNNPFVMCNKNHFDAYIVLDPTLTLINHKAYPFPRPLENFNNNSIDISSNKIIIGSFGFATKGKGFDKLIKAVENEFDEALIRINIPFGDYVTDEDSSSINYLKSLQVKKGIKVELTHFYFNKNELIDWCSQNSMNVFLYNRDMPGLSATTDQAIASGKPLAISTDPTFRHIHQYIKPFPFRSLRESLVHSQKEVETIKKKWNNDNFLSRFHNLLIEEKVCHIEKNGNSVSLNHLMDLNKKNLEINRKNIFKQYLSFFLKKITPNIKNISVVNQTKVTPVLTPNVSYILKSFSQFNEDLIISLLLRKSKGFYVDVGANDPFFNSNTYRFYMKGWNGINIEPNPIAFKKLNEQRERDLNLNLAIGDQEGELTIYYLSSDTTLSTLDYSQAIEMSKRLNLDININRTKVVKLETILDQQLKNSKIDFMTIDAEGYDLSVLLSNNWSKYRPTLVLIESNISTEEIYNFMEKIDYLRIFNNHYNTLFLDKYTNDEDLLNEIMW